MSSVVFKRLIDISASLLLVSSKFFVTCETFEILVILFSSSVVSRIEIGLVCVFWL